ncbi:MAG: DUF1080 domain-containing protein [Pseudomonadales bacterium]
MIQRFLRQSFYIITASVVSFTLSAEPANTTNNSDQTAKRWISLFDGSSLDGWSNFKDDDGAIDNWRIENDELSFDPGPWGILPLVSNYLFGGASRDLIYAKQAFSNFELRLQWKISAGGNSGVFYLVSNDTDDPNWHKGLEMQVLDDTGHDDGEIPSHRAGALYDLVVPQPEMTNPVGKWNSVVIRVQGKHIEHWLNGTKVVDIIRGSDDWKQRLAASKYADIPNFGMAQEGYIVLQDHGDPVWYRNIRIRKLH